MRGRVNACRADTYIQMRDGAVDAVHDLIHERGYTPKVLTAVLNDAFAGIDDVDRVAFHDELDEAARERIEAKGYQPSEIATKLPSVRAEFVKRFMYGRETVSLARSISMVEAVGLKCRLVWEVDESAAPSRRTDTPRAQWKRELVNHHSRKIYRSKRERHSLKRKVLNAWAKGLIRNPGDCFAMRISASLKRRAGLVIRAPNESSGKRMTRQECADIAGIEVGYADRIISIARSQGDPRAARRKAPYSNSNECPAEQGSSVADAGRSLTDTASSG